MLIALPFPIIIGDPRSPNVSNHLQTDCGPAALRINIHWKQIYH
ncbi:MAG: hypothetical protein ACTS5P_02320 [Candidatus Hodgkinia cicadicola]